LWNLTLIWEAEPFDRGSGYCFGIINPRRSSLHDLFRNNLGQGVATINKTYFSKGAVERAIKNSPPRGVGPSIDKLVDRHVPSDAINDQAPEAVRPTTED
jgi:hypothetical protein